MQIQDHMYEANVLVAMESPEELYFFYCDEEYLLITVRQEALVQGGSMEVIVENIDGNRQSLLIRENEMIEMWLS